MSAGCRAIRSASTACLLLPHPILCDSFADIMDVNRKDTPAPFAHSAQSPPRTPRAGNKRTSRLHKTPRDIYFQGLTDNARSPSGDDPTPNTRISHDLSLTANTGRSSVVDNMLLSLNPDQPKFESPPYPSASRFVSSESPRARRHLPSSSLNSDYSFPSPSSDSRPDSNRSAHHPRGRRSNSSNFQSLSRIDSLTTDEDKGDTRRTRTYQSQRAGLGGRTSLPPSQSGRKSSKSSGSSSVDFGQMMRQSAIGRRSASFDDGRRRPSFPICTSASKPIIYNNIEAAPTPTVPSGPRSPAILPPAPPQPAPAPTKKSFRYQTTRKCKVGPSNGAVGDEADSVQDAPLMSDHKEVRPFSPSKDHDSLLLSHQRPPSQSRDHVKERPGFFRRVFMSSRNANGPSHEVPPQPHSGNTARADSYPFMAPSRTSKVGLSGEANHAPGAAAAAPPPLAKKPSSFFRRRKNPVSDNIPALRSAPTIHPDLQSRAPMMNSNSSMSSLRELMSPYLSSSVEVRKGSTAGPLDSVPRNPGIPVQRSAVPQSAAPHASTNKPPNRGRRTEESISGISPSANREASPDDNLLRAHDNSFLHDNSSNETRLNATEPPSNHVTDSMPVDEPANNPRDKELRHDICGNEAPFNDGSIQSAQPVVDFVQDSMRRKPRGTKLTRSRTASGETFSMTGATGKSAFTEATPVKQTAFAAASPDESTPRVWLRPERSAEDLRKLAEASPSVKDAQTSQGDGDRPTLPRRPRIPIKIKTTPGLSNPALSDPRSPDFDATLPFREDRVLAQRVFEGDEVLVTKPKAAAWLGEEGPDRARVRRAYMELFDWQNLNILAALRDFCGRLLLKGETQQVDRILDAFSSRWCACNPSHGFKATGISYHWPQE